MSEVKVLTKAEADSLMTDANSFLGDNDISDIVIEDQTDYEIFTETLIEVKTLNNQLEEQKQSALKPLDQTVRIIRSWFKPTQDKLASAEAGIKRKLGEYILKQESDRKKALQEASSASRSGQDQEALRAIAKAGIAKVDAVDGTSYRYTYDIEIEDVTLLPDEWWTPDESAITRYVRATKGEKAIPGVVIHKRPIISQKT
jgi:hypothetical protein